MLTLYYAPGTCALASHIALEHAGADYRAVKLDFKANEQRSAEYLKVNPKGRVPALVSPQGVLTETPAILQYVAQAFPQAQLAPLDDPWALAKANEFNSYLCSTVHVNHAHKGRGHRWSDDPAAHESMKAKVTQNMTDCFDLIEREMVKGPFVLGERVGICDFYLFTIVQWLPGDGVDVSRFPKVAQLAQAVGELPATKRVLS